MMLPRFETLHWVDGETPDTGKLRLIDQTLLPTILQEIDCTDVETVWEAIRALRVRGAPAIGIAAGYGVCVGVSPLFRHGNIPGLTEWWQQLDKVVSYLATSRPTAVNLFWAIDRMKKVGMEVTDTTTGLQTLIAEAKKIHEEDRLICRKIGNFGAALVHDGDTLLTHCNAGGLATADYGTALAVFFAAAESGKRIRVFADETRPLLQGARLTAWELMQRGIDVTLICDSMAPFVMRQGKIQAVFVGADRIAANGDTANKIGTYGVAVSAKHHGIPFYVAAPSSTFDLTMKDGSTIPIEERPAEEITCGFGKRTAPPNVPVYNPAFDVTPAELITAIITERGIIAPVTTDHVRNCDSIRTLRPTTVTLPVARSAIASG